MIQQQRTVYSETSESSFRQKFSIREQDFKLVIELLRNRLYSDKIGSICREIACNSRDANNAAGKKDTPIIISVIAPDQLLNISTLSISFQDFGLGISPSGISEIYLNYGASTKQESNDFVGSFGLGSKSPFAYTDSFSVITIHEGIKYIYNLYIDESQQGECILLHQEPTDELSGTQVILPIEQKDRYNFETLSNYWTKTWSTVPKYVGFGNTPSKRDEVVFDHELFYITHRNHIPFIAESEGLPYPVSPKVVGDKVYEGFCIIAKFKIGEISFEASRETIEYTKQVTEVLKERFDFINEFLVNMLLDEFKKTTNQLDVYLYISKLTKGYELISSIYKYHKSNTLISSLNLQTIPVFEEHVLLDPMYPTSKISGFLSLSILPEEIYYVDCPLAKRKLVTLTNSGKKILLLRPNRILLLEPNTKVTAEERTNSYEQRTEKQKTELTTIFQNLGYDLKPLSEVPNAILPKGPAKPKSDLKEISYWMLQSSFVNGDAYRGTTYVSRSECCLLDEEMKPLDDYSVGYIVVENPSKTMFSQTLESAKIKVIQNFSDTQVFIITKSNEKYFKNQSSLDEALQTVPKKIFNDFIDHVYTVDYLRYNESEIETYSGMGFTFAKTLLAIKNDVRFENFNIEHLYSQERKFFTSLSKPSKVYNDCMDEISILNEKYPLISILLTRRLDPKELKKVNDYIELIDKQNETI